MGELRPISKGPSIHSTALQNSISTGITMSFETLFQKLGRSAPRDTKCQAKSMTLPNLATAGLNLTTLVLASIYSPTYTQQTS